MGSPFFFQPNGSGSGSGSGLTQFTYAFGASQPTTVGVSFMYLNSQTFMFGKLSYEIFRNATGPTTVIEVGNLYMFYNPAGTLWSLSRMPQGTAGATYDPGLSFQIGASGIVLMTAAGWDPTGYTGYINWKFDTLLELP